MRTVERHGGEGGRERCTALIRCTAGQWEKEGGGGGGVYKRERAVLQGSRGPV